MGSLAGGLGELAIVIYRVPQVLVPQQFLILAIYIYMIGIQTLANLEGLGELSIVIYRVPQVLVPQQFLILAMYIYMIGIQTLPNFEEFILYVPRILYAKTSF